MTPRYYAKRLLWNMAPGVMRFVAGRRVHWKWSIGILTGNSLLDLSAPNQVSNPVLTCHDVTDVHAGFVADPFMLRREGCWYMFFEVLNLQTDKGQIALATSSDGFEWEYQGSVLSGSQHFSYPYVFECQGEYYMVPESWKSGSVTLYRADPFPFVWKKVKDILHGCRIVDCSLFRFNGAWWMFADVSAPGNQGVLKLFGAEHPAGDWVEHPESPVVSGDICASRPAGRVVIVDGRPIRFSQDPLPRYGTRVRAYEIVEISSKLYRERLYGGSPLLGPGDEPWRKDGMHHVDAHMLDDGGWFACVDGFYWSGA